MAAPDPLAAFRPLRFPDRYSRGATGGFGFSTDVNVDADDNEERNSNIDQDRARFNLSHLVKRPDAFEPIRDFAGSMMGRAFAFRFKWWNDYQTTKAFVGLGDGTSDPVQLRKPYAAKLVNTAQAGGAATITLAASEAEYFPHDQNDAYNTFVVRLVGGTGSGQLRVITDYVGSSKIATVGQAWTTQPDATTVYSIECFPYNKDILAPMPTPFTLFANETPVAGTLDPGTGLFDPSGVIATDAVISWTGEFDLPARFDQDDMKAVFTSINSRDWRNIQIVETRDTF
jgi:uncharacterized protein (TIGR02217 family)